MARTTAQAALPVARATRPYEVTLNIECPVCGELVTSLVQVGPALTSRFGKSRLGAAMKAPRYDHTCGQATVDSAIARESDGDAPRLLA